MKVICNESNIERGFYLGEEYIVLAIHSYRYTQDAPPHLSYLIDSEGNDPIWGYSELFDISDNRVPKNWFLRIYPPDTVGTVYIFGFYEIVHDEHFYDKLFDGDKEAERIYYKRKAEYEETHTLELFKKFHISYSWLTMYVGRKLGNFSAKEIEKYAEEYLLENPDCTNRHIVQLACHEIVEEDIDNALLKILKDLQLEPIEKSSNQWAIESDKWQIVHSNDY